MSGEGPKSTKGLILKIEKILPLIWHNHKFCKIGDGCVKAMSNTRNWKNRKTHNTEEHTGAIWIVVIVASE